MNQEKENSKKMNWQDNCASTFVKVTVYTLEKDYKYTEEQYKDMINHVAIMDCGLSEWKTGFFPTKESAVAAVEEMKNDPNMEGVQLFVCVVYEHSMGRFVESGTHLKCWTYYDGKLLDEDLDGAFREEETPFLGRPQEKIRFRHGDIVMVADWPFGRWGIVYSVPMTEEQLKERKERIESGQGSDFSDVERDDDCYYVIYSDNTNLGNAEEVAAYRLLPPPPQGVPPFVEKALREGLRKAEKEFGWQP